MILEKWHVIVRSLPYLGVVTVTPESADSMLPMLKFQLEQSGVEVELKKIEGIVVDDDDPEYKNFIGRIEAYKIDRGGGGSMPDGNPLETMRKQFEDSKTEHHERD